MSSRSLSVDVDTSPEAMAAYRLAKTIHRSGGNPVGVFGLLAKVIEDRVWERIRATDGNPFRSFTQFVEAPDPGLNIPRDELVKLLTLDHPDMRRDPAWRERAPWLREQVARLLAEDVPPAGAVGRPEANVRGTHNSGVGPDTAQRAIARLKRDDPDLAARVVAGEVTANAAAREKGWRKPRIVLSSPASVAVRLRQHFTPAQVAELRNLLDES